MSVCLSFSNNWQIGCAIVVQWHIIMPDGCEMNFRKQMKLLHGNERANGWTSLYRTGVYVNEACADLTCGANHRKTRAEGIMTGINLPILGGALCSLT